MRGQKVMDTFYGRLKETWSYHTHHPGLPVRFRREVAASVHTPSSVEPLSLDNDQHYNGFMLSTVSEPRMRQTVRVGSSCAPWRTITLHCVSDTIVSVSAIPQARCGRCCNRHHLFYRKCLPCKCSKGLSVICARAATLKTAGSVLPWCFVLHLMLNFAP